ncbi:MAG: GYD family protein [Planctomycetes bacterium]|jgi:uncharacterized protein with GYD domain|nr:GYD family protein [Planctomycetota bacterium]
MPTFLTLITETREGESTIRDSIHRTATFREEAQGFGVTVKELRWTMGSYDGFVLFEAPDSSTACSLLHHLTSKGSVRTQTMQTFDAVEMESILDRAQL